MKIETSTKDGLIQSRVPMELKEKFYEIAHEKDIPPAQILRRLIADFVKKEEKKLAV